MPDIARTLEQQFFSVSDHTAMREHIRVLSAECDKFRAQNQRLEAEVAALRAQITKGGK